MDYSDRQVIVTGGTGALGSAVGGALIEAGATCYVPWRHQSEAQEFTYRQNEHVKLFGSIDLTDEAAVPEVVDASGRPKAYHRMASARGWLSGWLVLVAAMSGSPPCWATKIPGRSKSIPRVRTSGVWHGGPLPTLPQQNREEHRSYKPWVRTYKQETNVLKRKERKMVMAGSDRTRTRDLRRDRPSSSLKK